MDRDDLCERQRGHGERLHPGKDLRPDEELAAIESIDKHSGKWSQKKRGDLSGEAYNTEQEGRAGKPVDEPAGGDASHPGADQRDALAGKEESKVAMTQRSPRMGVAAGGSLC